MVFIPVMQVKIYMWNNKQLILIKLDLAKDHIDESLKFEQEYQQMVRATFDFSHSQDIDSLNR